MDPNDKKISVLAIEVEPVTATDPKFWKWADQRLDSSLGTRSTRSLVMVMSGTSHIDQSLWVNLTRLIYIGMGQCFRHNKANSNPLPPLVHKWDTGSSTAIGHWQR